MSKSDRLSYIALIASAKVRAFRRCDNMTIAQRQRVLRRLCRD